jgi:hypothetical protein
MDMKNVVLLFLHLHVEGKEWVAMAFVLVACCGHKGVRSVHAQEKILSSSSSMVFRRPSMSCLRLFWPKGGCYTRRPFILAEGRPFYKTSAYLTSDMGPLYKIQGWCCNLHSLLESSVIVTPPYPLPKTNFELFSSSWQQICHVTFFSNYHYFGVSKAKSTPKFYLTIQR